MNSTFTEKKRESIVAGLATANAAFARTYPRSDGRRQPVHTVYGGAQIFKADTAPRMGAIAIKHLSIYAPDAASMARFVGKDDDVDLFETVYDRVLDKLENEPVEDFRIDFEDGFGNRPDPEEDAEAIRAAAEVAKGMADGMLPPFVGIRIKPFSSDLHERSMRTLDLFLTSLLDQTSGCLPDNFVVTLPKVVVPEQVGALADCFEAFEEEMGLSPGALKLEIMVETPQSIIGPGGGSALRGLVAAARGRCVAAHFGVYDYTALCEITAEHQSMTHPACDFARDMMQVSLAGSGVWLSDGATNIMPVGPHRAADGKQLARAQIEENETAVARAWRLGFDHISHSLSSGYYQGWDLHPAQLPIRYAAVYWFFLSGLDSATRRLRSFVERAAQATLSGEVFDDAATGQAMLNYFLRALSCGAISEKEALATGLSVEELQTRSFYKILTNRRSGAALK